ncbi:hypothetical protein MLD38_036605 [Melastoma candidum]|uniref:Uncharacterized protein n=1 Tax=Melastoma candidum TaxID=119954 RepID=A0ACB9LK62_9MYRT|nr:hypothetical protein MLD38_036605 [Melastoma candidum]
MEPELMYDPNCEVVPKEILRGLIKISATCNLINGFNILKVDLLLRDAFPTCFDHEKLDTLAFYFNTHLTSKHKKQVVMPIAWQTECLQALVGLSLLQQLNNIPTNQFL